MNRWLCRLVMCLVFLSICLTTRAEVSVDSGGGARVNTIVLAGIVDGSDPIGSIWQPFRLAAGARILNPSGYVRGDGPPDLAALPDERPVALWAYNAGSDHDIALSEWTGTQWSPNEYLTMGPEDELDPRIFVEPDGTLHAVWWTEGSPGRVFLLTKPAATSLWEGPIEVVSGARRPSVAVLDGVLHVSYERDSTVPGMAQDVVVLRRDSAGGFSTEFVESSTRANRLDAVLHVSPERLWLDWKQDSQEFGFSEYGQPGWSAVGALAWPEPSWLCVEETRKIIRNQVFGN